MKITTFNLIFNFMNEIENKKPPEIYLCDVQFSVTVPKSKQPNILNTEKLVLLIDENNNPVFKQYEMQAKHNQFMTPTAKQRIVDLKVVRRVTFLGTSNFEIEKDKRFNFKYYGKHTGKK